MKRGLVVFATVLAAALLLTGCFGKKPSGSNNSNNNNNPGGQSTSVKEGQWPESVYKPYGIDAPNTSGKIVYTELSGEDDYNLYKVDYRGVTREEFDTWIGELKAKGFRTDENTDERLQKSWDYDIELFFPEEKSTYKLMVSFDFNEDMSFEVYEDDKNYVISWEKDEYGDERGYIYYNLTVGLRKLKTERTFEGSFPELGFTANDLDFDDRIRTASAGSAAFLSSVNIHFYGDHLTTKDDLLFCHHKFIDLLASKGAKFTDTWTGAEKTAEELKADTLIYFTVSLNGNTYTVSSNPDMDCDHFGDAYGLILTKK